MPGDDDHSTPQLDVEDDESESVRSTLVSFSLYVVVGSRAKTEMWLSGCTYSTTAVGLSGKGTYRDVLG